MTTADPRPRPKQVATLPAEPTGADLEDLVAAHLVSRGVFVERGVTERNPLDILELDIVWTDYRHNPPRTSPIEVKSGSAHLGDVFKFYGWTQYLGLPPGQFIHCNEFATADHGCLKHVSAGTGVHIVKVTNPSELDPHLESLGFAPPTDANLPIVWRFSFWAQRRLLEAFGQIGKKKTCIESLKSAKEYHRLINDALFFMPDVNSRVEALLAAHLGHQRLAATFALQLETGRVEFATPGESSTFKAALYDGRHFPVQTCMYLGHRARLSILKAAVDFWLAKRNGVKAGKAITTGKRTVLEIGPYSAFVDAVAELSKAKSFAQFPVFWQVFLWGWGGFLLEDREEEEHAALAKETGVLAEDIPTALKAFDLLFPLSGSWFRRPYGTHRRLLMQMPPPLRGVGAYRRRLLYACKGFSELGYTDWTPSHLSSDVTSLVRLLTCASEDLAK